MKSCRNCRALYFKSNPITFHCYLNVELQDSIEKEYDGRLGKFVTVMPSVKCRKVKTIYKLCKKNDKMYEIKVGEKGLKEVAKKEEGCDTEVPYTGYSESKENRLSDNQNFKYKHDLNIKKFVKSFVNVMITFGYNDDDMDDILRICRCKYNEEIRHIVNGMNESLRNHTED